MSLNRQVSCRTLLWVAVALVVVVGLALLALVGWFLPWREQVALETSTTPLLGVTTVVSPVPGTPVTDIPVSLDPTPSPYWDRVYVEYILDASGSMLEEMDGERKIDIAKEVLAAKAGQLPATTNVGLRVYGHRVHYSDKEKSCQDIELLVPPVRGGRDRLLEKLPTLEAQGMTPLSEAVIQSVDDFDHKDPFRHNSLVVISDGEETCGGDPCTMADDLVNVYGIRFTLYVIGFDILDNPTAQKQLRCLADRTGGVYVEANSRDELARALDGMWQAIDQQTADAYQEQQPPTEVAATGPTDTATPLPPTPTPAVAPAPTSMRLPTNLLRITADNIGQVVEVGRLGKGNLGAIAYSPDGRLLAVSSRVGIWLYDSETLAVVSHLEGKEGGSIAFSPDGTMLASGGSGFWADSEVSAVRLWRVADGALLRIFEEHIVVVDLAFSPDGTKLAAEHDDNTIQLWQVDDGLLLHTLKGPAEWDRFDMAFSPDGNVLAWGGEDGEVLLWQVSDGSLLHSWQGDTDGDILCVAFSPDGTMLASGDDNGTISLWRVSDGSILQTLQGWGWTYSIAFSPDGTMLVATDNDYPQSRILVWQVSSGELLRTLGESSGEVYMVAFAPDGETIASIHSDRSVRFWSAMDGQLVRSIEEHVNDIHDLAFSPDGTALVSGSWNDRGVQLWSITDMQLLYTMQGYSGPVYSVDYSPDGELLASALYDNTAGLWRAADGSLLHTLEGSARWIDRVAFSPDGAILAVAACDNTVDGLDNVVQLWRTSDWVPLRTLEGKRCIESVAFSPDGTLLASSWGDGVRLWRVSDGVPVHSLDGYEYYTRDVAFSPDGTILATTGVDNVGVVDAEEKEVVRLWRTADMALMATLEGPKDLHLSGLAFSPDGTLLASGTGHGSSRDYDYSIWLWQMPDGAFVQTLEGHKASINHLSFSPDGTLLASGDGDGLVRLWGVPGGAGQASPATTTPSPTAPTSEHQSGEIHTRAQDKMQMVYVPAGEFLMGSDEDYRNRKSYENPQHTVYLDAYWIDRTEVTNAQFARFLNDSSNTNCDEYGRCISTPQKYDSLHPGKIRWDGSDYIVEEGYEDHPVLSVSWEGAQWYCEWVGTRLPSEAEWEKAARGTDGREYPWGNSVPDCIEIKGAFCTGGTTPVGSYPEAASPYGVLDMAGNAWEWTADWYDRDYYATSPYRNPKGPDSSPEPIYKEHVLRGGGSNEISLRCTYRPAPSFVLVHNGFRCAASANGLP